MPRVPPVTNATRPANLSVEGALAGSGWGFSTWVMICTSRVSMCFSSADFRECKLGGVGTAHAVCAGPRWGGRRADVHAGHADPVRRQRDSRPEHQLPDVF